MPSDYQITPSLPITFNHTRESQRYDLVPSRQQEQEIHTARSYIAEDLRTGEKVGTEFFKYVHKETLKEARFGGVTGQVMVVTHRGTKSKPSGFYRHDLGGVTFADRLNVDRTYSVAALCHIKVHRIHGREIRVHLSATSVSDFLPPIEEETVVALMNFIVAEIDKAIGQPSPPVAVERPPDPPPPQPQREPEPARAATKMTIFDANPKLTGIEKIETASAEELLHQCKTSRDGAATDGVSKLLIVAEVYREGIAVFATDSMIRVEERLTETDAEKRAKQLQKHTDALEARDGTFVTLFNRRAVKVGDKHYVFALYTPPSQFDYKERPSGGTWKQAVQFRNIRFKVSFKPAGESPLVSEHQFIVARPPVVLAHGTFDNPKSCWQSSAEDEPMESKHGALSMESFLRRRGFFVSSVDYETTNGSWALLGRDKSSFADNAKVLGENRGGIKETLDDFRKKTNLAASQVDVVGHSLGGLLARLWASEHYNKDNYKRADNFGAGDIRRLVTIGTPHHGSDLAEVVQVFAQSSVRTVGIRERAVSAVASQYLKWGEATAMTGALRDQVPQSEALRNIGATPIPAHAIVGVASAADLREFGGVYQNRLETVWNLFHYQPRTLKTFLEGRGQGDLVEKFHGEVVSLSGNEPSFLNDGYVLRIRDKAVLMHLLRGAVFGMQQTDMTVRLESQAGGLPLPYTTMIHGALHSYQPRYEKVQRRVAELLAGGECLFHPDGFPAAGAALLNVGKFNSTQDPAERTRAIATSGMVPAQAEAFSVVARQRGVIIVVRPVNHDATPLIAENNATKDMHVKGKSSNWGPQAGYIAVQQRFSKLWFDRNREEQVKKFDDEVTHCLEDERARTTELTITVADELYDVRIVNGETDAIKAIVLRNKASGKYFNWQNDGERLSRTKAPAQPPAIPASDANTEAMLVLADRFSGLALTADYDFLTFGTRERAPPTKLPFDPEMGYVSPMQKNLILQLNYSVRLRANYSGGNVSHHGPETQYPKSPGVDFPLAVFEPDGDIRILPAGEPHRLDVHVKTYFHQKRQLGWNFEPNPVWLWGDYDPQEFPDTGWQPDDDPNEPRKKTRGAPRPPDDPFDSNEGTEGRSPLALPPAPDRPLLPAGSTP